MDVVALGAAARVGETTQPMDVLIIEDDPLIGRSLREGFAQDGCHCVWTKEGSRGLALAGTQKFDCIILDQMLPGLSGLDVLRELRTAGIQVPVIMLTALGAVEDRVTGLNAGADDYVVKPFAIVELKARVHAICRRTSARPSPVIQVGDLVLDLTTRRVLRSGKEIELTPTEFSLLELLMRYAGQVVTRKMLCEHLWDSDWEGTTNVIEVHINRLRGKLNRGFEEPLIETIRGRGYALRAP